MSSIYQMQSVDNNNNKTIHFFIILYFITDMRVCDGNEHVNICQNRGICINQPDPNGLKVLYRCECLPGFYGTHCEKQINNCRFHGCNNRGKCKVS